MSLEQWIGPALLGLLVVGLAWIGLAFLRRSRRQRFERYEQRPAAAPQAKTPSGPGTTPPARPASAEERAAALEAELERRLTGAPAAVDGESPDVAVPPEEVAHLRRGLAKTQSGLMSGLARLLWGDRALADEHFAELETLLYSADIGVRTVAALQERLRAQLRAGRNDGPTLKALVRAEISALLAPSAAARRGLADPATRPAVYLFVGVNGVGKTTTIGKLAHQLRQQGRSVLLAAGDTFRAAAADQLQIWAERAGARFVRGDEGSDPASVVFNAVKTAQAEGLDCVLADTAGRLHTKANLMEELKKVARVLGKARPGAPDETLLVVDATTGQNAIHQAREFNAALGLTGIALTKLDGTAKGGVIIGINAELGIPVRFVGVGETLDDLRPFEAAAYVEALFGE